jgi:hypothetical protein
VHANPIDSIASASAVVESSLARFKSASNDVDGDELLMNSLVSIGLKLQWSQVNDSAYFVHPQRGSLVEGGACQWPPRFTYHSYHG